MSESLNKLSASLLICLIPDLALGQARRRQCHHALSAADHPLDQFHAAFDILDEALAAMAA